MTQPSFSTAHNYQTLDAWVHKVNRLCGSFQARLAGDHFDADIKANGKSGINTACVSVQNAHAYRTRKEILQDDSQHFFAIFQLSGQSFMQQEDRRCKLSRGDITLIDAGTPCDFHFDKLSHQMSLILPYDLVRETTHREQLLCAERISGTSHLGKLANLLISETLESQVATSADEGNATLSALLTLLQPIVCSQTAESTHDKALRKALTFIDKNLCAVELSPAVVADNVGVSIRNLYRIFAKKKLVIGQYIKERRLSLCAEKLRNAKNHESLSTICFSCGFSDTSYFSTAFRKHFGLSPSEYRRRAQKTSRPTS